MKYDISVIVGTYKPVWEKLKATLCSVIKQENIKLQVIVSDDGSVNPLFSEAKLFFEKNDFYDYKFVRGTKNEGTVSQFYRGVKAADAEYVKGISPGDLFYDKLVLSNWLKFTKESNAEVTFGDVIFYNRNHIGINVIRHEHNPKNLAVYKKSASYRDKVINYYFLGDTISGSAILVRKTTLIYYLKLLYRRVIYAEDFFLRLAVLDNCKIEYYPHKCIWYEFGDGGISTTKSVVWEKRLRKDSIAMDEICLEQYSCHNKEIYCWILEKLKYRKEKEIHGIIRKLFICLKHPSWLYWGVYQKLFVKYSPVDVDARFIEYCFDPNNSI